MNKLAVLDVDGVCRHNDRSKQGGNFYTLRYEDVDWIEGAIEAHRLLYDMGYKIFWVTMQNCIAENKIAFEDCREIFAKMKDYVNRQLGRDAVVDFSICVTEEDSEAKIEAKKRAVESIIRNYKIHPNQSFGCGDARSDIIAFKMAGITTNVHIDLPDTTAKNDHNVIEADGIAPNLLQAVQRLQVNGYDANSLFIEQVNKLTGREHIILNDKASDRCYKILQIFKGVKSSYHYHKNKDERFTVLRGVVEFEVNNHKTKAESGDYYYMLVGECHSFEAVTDMAIILEESTYHEDSDTYRLTNSQAV